MEASSSDTEGSCSGSFPRDACYPALQQPRLLWVGGVLRVAILPGRDQNRNQAGPGELSSDNLVAELLPNERASLFPLILVSFAVD